MSESNRSVILTKIQSDLPANEIKNKLLTDHFSEVAFLNTIEKIVPKAKGAFMIVCNSWTECKNLVAKYKDTAFLNHVPTFTMFSETDPSKK